jgi:CheY-like chemotaxis protein
MSIAAVQKSTWSYVLSDRIKILVADDDPILCEFASVHLTSPSAVIETAPDGEAALAWLHADRFDLALLDIQMPSLDGFALLETIRSDPKLGALPVIMLTGHEDIASVDRAFSLGANSFVSKPVNWRLLSYHIRYVLRASRAEQEVRQARAQAEANEASHLRTLRNAEVESRAVLKSIQQCADCGRAAAPHSAQECFHRIEQLAAAALRRWDEPAAVTIGATGGEILSAAARA